MRVKKCALHAVSEDLCPVKCMQSQYIHIPTYIQK